MELDRIYKAVTQFEALRGYNTEFVTQFIENLKSEDLRIDLKMPVHERIFVALDVYQRLNERGILRHHQSHLNNVLRTLWGEWQGRYD